MASNIIFVCVPSTARRWTSAREAAAEGVKLSIIASICGTLSPCATPPIAKRSRSFVSSAIALLQRSGRSPRVGIGRKKRVITVETESSSGIIVRFMEASPKTSRAQGTVASRSRA